MPATRISGVFDKDAIDIHRDEPHAMLILMNPNATQDQIEAVCRRAREIGLTPHELPDSSRVAIGVGGDNGSASPGHFNEMPGVAECVTAPRPYKLVSREFNPKSTIVEVRGARIGDGGLTIIGGPCSVESRDQVLACARVVSASGGKFFRGGAFKPRSSPYAFQGLKEEGLRLLEEVKRQFDLRIVTEVRDIVSLESVAQVADVLQIGARNMQNTSLLEATGKLRCPVLLKRGMSATISELFMAAEYLLALGNNQVILCERGIRTFERMTRNTFDISSIVMIKHHSHLPVIADPSHGVGVNWAVPPLARAAVVAGADGVMVETHPHPEAALSDGQQALTLDEYRSLVKEMTALAAWRVANG
jgi:3-deoxy-7-phosphoheptulonate synthase